MRKLNTTNLEQFDGGFRVKQGDLNFIQFTFNENIPTDKDIGDIRVSAISYLTDEPWPTKLP